MAKAKSVSKEVNSLPDVNRRAVLSANVSLGLLNVPVQIVTMDVDQGLHFNTLERKNGKPINQKKVSSVSGDILEADQLIKGYELDDGSYVMLEKDEIDAVKPKSTKKLEIQKFVKAVDPVFYETSYTLTPGGGDGTPYVVLRDTLAKMGRAALVSVSMRSSEHPAIIHEYHGALILTTLRRRDEVVDPSQVRALRELPEAPKKMVEMAMNIMDDEDLQGEYDPSAFKDHYKEQMLSMIEDKRAGKKIVVAKPESEEKTNDLMAALEAMNNKKGKGKKTVIGA